MKESTRGTKACAALLLAALLCLPGCAITDENRSGSPDRSSTQQTPAAQSVIRTEKPAPAYDAEIINEEVAPMDAENRIWNVRDFGAEGNGRTDDYFSIQTAVNTVLRAGGGTVYFPDGNYRISETLRITMEGEAPLTLLADVASSAILVTTADIEGPAVYVNHPYVTISHLGIQDSCTKDSIGLVLASDHALIDQVSVWMTNGNSMPAIQVYGSYNTIKHSGVGYSDTTPHMVEFTKKPGTVAYGNVLEDCHFGGTHAKCVLVTSEDPDGAPEYLTIRRNVFLVVSCDQVEVQAAKGLYIVDNMLDAAGVCVLMDPLPVGIDGVQITDNYCGASTGGERTGGIRTETNHGGFIRQAVVSANYFWSQNCISFVSDRFGDFKLTDNYFVTTGGTALYLADASGSFIEGNVYVAVGGEMGLRIDRLDDDTVIQHNGFGKSVTVPAWEDRFAALN